MTSVVLGGSTTEAGAGWIFSLLAPYCTSNYNLAAMKDGQSDPSCRALFGWTLSQERREVVICYRIAYFCLCFTQETAKALKDLITPSVRSTPNSTVGLYIYIHYSYRLLYKKNIYIHFSF